MKALAVANVVLWVVVLTAARSIEGGIRGWLPLAALITSLVIDGLVLFG